MWVGMIESDEYTPVKRGNRMRPVPRTATLNDFIVGNTFAQLQDNEGNGNDGVGSDGEIRALHKSPKTKSQESVLGGPAQPPKTKS